MKRQPIVTAVVGIALAITSSGLFAQGRQGQGQDRPRDRAQIERGQRDLDRERPRDRDRLDKPAQDRVRDRDQDRLHVPDFAKLSDRDIYGSEVMSVQERNQYRQQLQTASNEGERKRIEARHREMVEARAKSRGIDLAPPGRDIYGGALMSVEERNRYREQLRMIDSDDERAMLKARHREEMQARAKAQGIDLYELEETEEAE